MAAMLYLQYAENIHPCLLCLIQRFFLGGMILISLCACVFSMRCLLSRILIHTLAFLFSALGLISALRQIWLQCSPQRGPVQCLPDALELFQNCPVIQTLQAAYTQSAYCGEITRLFGINLAAWAAVCFAVLLLLSLWAMWKSSIPRAH